MTGEPTPVVIVGGGLAGLSMALFLSWHDVPCLLVERHRGTSPHPRARGIHPRAMEMMRSAGLETAIRSAASARALADNSGVIAAQSLAGKELGALQEQYLMDVRTDLSALSPTSWCLCHQDEFEPILRARAEELGARIRFGTELVSFTQDAEGLTALLRNRDTAATDSVRASYLIAADGPASPVRTSLGIPFEGTEPLGHYLNIHFRSDLRAQLGGRRFVMCYTFNPAVRGALMPLDNAERWLLHVLFDPREQAVETFTDDRCLELVRAAAGVPGLQAEILGVMPWEASGRVAGRFAEGRVFVIGDAAHVMPPSGAFGSNTGIQDAHNLAWKIASVVHGHARPALLDSYDAERRPVGAATVEQAVLRSKDRPRMAQEAPPPPNPAIVPDTTVWFGGRYTSAAVVVDGGPATDSPGADSPAGVWVAEPAGLPGTRAPHVPLELDGGPLSTLDLFGRTFVLLAGPEGEPWCAAGEHAAERLGLPLGVHRISADGLVDVKDAWCEAYGVTPAGAALVRPDGVVAWRATGAAEEPDRVLADVLRRVLSIDAE
jgi:putative polyketide hydroxylase